MSSIDMAVEAKLAELRDEFGENSVTDLLVDTAMDSSVAQAVLDAEPRLRAISQQFSGKAHFMMHREPNGDLYILRTLKPSEWNASWLQLLAGRDDVFEQHAPAVLAACMVYPSFDETDWEYEGLPKLNAPLGMTRTRLLTTFFQSEMGDMSQPNSITFETAHLDNAIRAAGKSAKKSL
jgi:hypothetical protein